MQQDNQPNQSEEVPTPILLVEDDVKLAELVITFLTKNGFQVHHEVNGLHAIEAVSEHAPQLIILDIMLPGLDGLSVCRKLRDSYPGPILMLTALNDDIDEVAGLEMGADGYLGKPIKPRVLLAHIRAHLRRISLQRIENNLSENEQLILAGRLKIDAGKRQVWVNTREIELTAAEFDLLWLLAEQKGQITDREELHKKIFRLEYDGLDRNIDIRVSRLRKKLGDDPKHPELIKTVRGQGYILAD
ncbi:response regulator transcription factor [Aliikangiella coralliicola]|uniref:Response regulator transcription factor n=1 Tax=Aliikangiella coralliicola TaxID=2592383 RepID=A0A545UII7_9GAMM|nr:response regulator transcription factor [Aliikangiella coralliicola]TQV89270.1 response regulator transcription factor [Aliikangiella coralliicola]